MLVKIYSPDFIFNDERGSLVQLVHKGWQQINVINSKKEVIRGNHYHKINNEAFYVVEGKFVLIAKKDEVKEQYIFKKGDFFSIGPNIIHSFEYLEDTILVSMYDKGVELGNETKDIYTE